MCNDCAETRKKLLDALLAARIAEAVKVTAVGAAKLAGIKDKG